MKSVVTELLAAAEQGMKISICTVIDAPLTKREHVGKIMLVYPDGEVSGSLEDEDLTQLVIAKMRQMLWEQPVMLEFEQDGRYRVFWDSTIHKRKAVVFGAGHISQPLVEMLALVDFSVTVVDDRPDFANASRFPWADSIICDQFQKALQVIKSDSGTAVIIVTRGHRYDMECLRVMLTKEFGYIGMIGSRRRVHDIRKLMAEEGIAKEVLARLHAPIGLDIGAQTPAEIAVAITAEVIGNFRSGSSPVKSCCKEATNHG